ncbi:MAG: FecR family protein [Sphingomonas sp.]
MTDHGDIENETGQLRQEAAAWFARMRGPDADRYRRAFDDWLARGALHRGAYNRIAETFSAGKTLKEEQVEDAARRNANLFRGALVSAILCIIVLTAFGLDRWKSANATLVGDKPAQFVSVIGQMRRIGLSDGSVVTLDSNSLLSVRFSRSSRYLRLERGRARFAVIHDGRPFTVFAGDDRVVAHGTVFDVGFRDDGGVDVALLRGAIDVTKLEHMTGKPAGRSVTLAPGHGIVSMPRAGLSAPVPIESEPDWTRQIAAFDRAHLSEVVAAANRYSVDKIVIADPEVARLRVSGTFRIVDAPRLCARLAALFGLVVDTRTPGMIVLRHHPSE